LNSGSGEKEIVWPTQAIQTPRPKGWNPLGVKD
jgi:hypothetical protein